MFSEQESCFFLRVLNDASKKWKNGTVVMYKSVLSEFAVLLEKWCEVYENGNFETWSGIAHVL